MRKRESHIDEYRMSLESFCKKLDISYDGLTRFVGVERDGIFPNDVRIKIWRVE